MCFEGKFTNYFIKTKSLTVLPWANKVVFKELCCNSDKAVTPFLCLSGFFRFFLFYSFRCINKLLLCWYVK